MARVPQWAPHLNGSERVSLDQRYLLTRQLHVLQRSGVPLLSSLHALQRQLAVPALQRILRRMHHDLLEGKTLSQAMTRHPGAFTPIYVGLVRVGEAGGLLAENLQQLADLLEWEIELRNRLREALQYPCIVLMTLAAAVTLMAVFVLPRFAEMFRSFRITLPLQTRMLIALSDFIRHYGVAVILVGMVVIGACWAYVRAGRGRMQWHRWQLRLPLIGSILRQLAMSRVARVIAALHRSGVPILETLALAGESVNNRYVRARLELIHEQVKGGGALAWAMRQDSLFPPVVTEMVATGEATGRVDELLQSVSEYYDQQTTYVIRRLITALEPLLLLVVGAGVLLMATAVFVPMWDLVQIFKQQGR